MSLLTAIFDELSTQLGNEFSTSELMEAAQRLIDLSKHEYLPKEERRGYERANLYSMDLVTAFEGHIWRITSADSLRMSHCDLEEFTPETFQNARLFLQGSDERLWEF